MIRLLQDLVTPFQTMSRHCGKLYQPIKAKLRCGEAKQTIRPTPSDATCLLLQGQLQAHALPPPKREEGHANATCTQRPHGLGREKRLLRNTQVAELWI